MKIQRGFKTELDLNQAQRLACVQHAGAARFAYNWGLARKQAAYQAGEKTPSAIDLHRELNRLKKAELAWMYEVSKCAPQEALRNLDRAYANFFRRAKAKRAGQLTGKVGFPRFKSKKNGLGSFRLTGAIHIFERHIQLPRLGSLRLKERGYLPLAGARILSAVVSEQAGRWYVAVQVEMEIPAPQPGDKPVVGVDLGLKTLATVSDGAEIANPKALRRALVKIKRLQRVVSRRMKGGANRKKAVRKLARAHQRAANVRKNVLHQATTWLTKTNSAIGLENLNVRGMMKNHRLAGGIADAGFSEFRRQVEYKGAWYGCRVVLADRFFPSSKRHADCGHVYADLQLAEREWVCPGCGAVVPRDLNAARNLEQLAQATASYAGSNACGERVSPATPAVLGEAGTKPPLTPGRKARNKKA